MDGTSASGNSNYTFAADPLAPWVTVNSTTGVVKFTGTPTTAQTVNIAITDNRGGPATTFSFRVGTWFINNGTNYTTAAGADSYCSSKAGYTTPSYQKMTNAAALYGGTRAADGRLWDEWGDVGADIYTGFNWMNNGHWTKDMDNQYRYIIRLKYGNFESTGINQPFYVVCSRTL